MRILFITPSPVNLWVSSRMRGAWLVPYLPGSAACDIHDLDKLPGLLDYDAYVFVKLIATDLLPQLEAAGKRIYVDYCDPVWWFNPKGMSELLPHVHGVVCSNTALADDFTAWSGIPAHTIPDRLELSHFPRQRVHKEVETVRFVWFGASQNRVALLGAIANLDRLAANGYQFSLSIYDDQPDQHWGISNAFPVEYKAWSLEDENEFLAGHDIALLPPYPGAWGKVKSNNKSLTAGACGLPVATGEDYFDLERLVKYPDVRAIRGSQNRTFVESECQIERSAREWEALLS